MHPYGKLGICIVLILSILGYIHLDNKKSLNKLLLKIEAHTLSQKLQEKIYLADNYLEDAKFIRRASEFEVNIEELHHIKNNGFAIIIFDHGNLKFWSSSYNFSYYTLSEFETNDTLYNYKSQYYWVHKRIVDNIENLMALAVIPVYSDYKINNSYLENGFAPGLGVSSQFTLINDSDFNSLSVQDVRSSNGTLMFRIDTSPEYYYSSKLHFVLVIICLLFILYIGYFVMDAMYKKWHIMKALFFNFILLLLIYYIFLVYLKSILKAFDFDLFAPEVYATNASLNCLASLFIWSYFLFLTMYNVYKSVKLKNIKIKRQSITIITLTILSTYYFYYAITLLQLLENSSLFQDLWQSDFLSLSYWAGAFSLLFLSISLYYIVHSTYRLIAYYHTRIIDIISIIGMSLVVFFLWSIYFNISLWHFVYFALGYLIIGLHAVMVHSNNSSPYAYRHTSLFGVIIWLLISASFIQQLFTLEKKRAETFVITKTEEQDLFLEYLLQGAIDSIEHDNFVKLFIKEPFNLSGSIVVDRIQARHLSSYFNSYNVNIFILNKDSMLLESTTPITISDLIELMNLNQDTSLQIINATNNAQQVYVATAHIYDRSVLGNVILHISPKPDAGALVYPELLIDKKYVKKTNNDLSYAIYKNGILLNINGSAPFSRLFPSNIRTDTIVNTLLNGYVYKHYMSDNKRAAIAAYKQKSIFDWLSVFTFWGILLFLCLFIIYSFELINRLIIYKRTLFHYLFSSFRTKIQFIIAFIILSSSLIIVSFIVFLYIKQNSEKQFNTLYQKKLIIENDVQENFILPLGDTLYNAEQVNYKQAELQALVNKIARKNLIDLNVYTMNGELLATSQADIFNHGIISTIINPNAYLSINKQGNSHYECYENIGKLKYISAYSPLLNNQGQQLAIMQIPYFDEAKQAGKEVAHFVVSIIDLFGLFLILGLIISYFLGEQITSSLRTISQKLTKIKLQYGNERLEWVGEDEIAILVNEYNVLVNKLEQSARNLADSEREKAWREMAKQVAHEIKNPLTPMKLNLQYLQKAIADDRPNVKELAFKFSKNLIEQIDILSAIASQFSQFAQMPTAHPEKVLLQEALQSAMTLYNSEEKVCFDLIDNLDTKAFVMIDVNHLHRVLTNIIKNAIQAIPADRQGIIQIALSQQAENYHISITDNGIGIAMANIDQIFLPHFSTKSSGMGIGLSMVKSIVENANGKIWCDSQMGRGTTFHIELPIYINA